MAALTQKLSSPPASQPDRQKHHRVPYDDQVTLFPVIESNGLLEIPEKNLKAQSRDLSESGIRLELKRNQRPTPIVKVCFNLRGLKPLTVYAKLIWKKGSTFGFQYIVLDDADRNQIKEYVKHARGGISDLGVDDDQSISPKKTYPFYWGNLSG